MSDISISSYHQGSAFQHLRGVAVYLKHIPKTLVVYLIELKCICREEANEEL